MTLPSSSAEFLVGISTLFCSYSSTSLKHKTPPHHYVPSNHCWFLGVEHCPRRWSWILPFDSHFQVRLPPCTILIKPIFIFCMVCVHSALENQSSLQKMRHHRSSSPRNAYSSFSPAAAGKDRVPGALRSSWAWVVSSASISRAPVSVLVPSDMPSADGLFSSLDF